MFEPGQADAQVLICFSGSVCFAQLRYFSCYTLEILSDEGVKKKKELLHGSTVFVGRTDGKKV